MVSFLAVLTVGTQEGLHGAAAAEQDKQHKNQGHLEEKKEWMAALVG